LPLAHNPHRIARALAYALRQRGTPYVWGGSAPGGFDCSGLIYWAYRKAGYQGIGRTTYDQIKQGIAVGPHNLQPGDIIFPSAHHEGIYVGNGMVLEAPHTGDHVKVIPLSEFGFMTARRLIGGGGGVTPPRRIAGQGIAGLPIGSGNPADRLPHPGGNVAAGMAALSLIKPVSITPPHLPLQGPADALQKILHPGLCGADEWRPTRADHGEREDARRGRV
jgi:hypothetical protein